MTSEGYMQRSKTLRDTCASACRCGASADASETSRRKAFGDSCRRYDASSTSSSATSSVDDAAVTAPEAAEGAEVAPAVAAPAAAAPSLAPCVSSAATGPSNPIGMSRSTRMLACRSAAAAVSASSSRTAARRTAAACAERDGDASTAFRWPSSVPKTASAACSPHSSSSTSAGPWKERQPMPRKRPESVSIACDCTSSVCASPCSREQHAAKSARIAGLRAASSAGVAVATFVCSHTAFTLRSKSES